MASQGRVSERELLKGEGNPLKYIQTTSAAWEPINESMRYSH